MIKYIGKCLLVVENSEKILVIGDLHLGFEEVLFTYSPTETIITHGSHVRCN